MAWCAIGSAVAPDFATMTDGLAAVCILLIVEYPLSKMGGIMNACGYRIEPGKRMALTSWLASIVYVPVGTLTSAVARAKATKSDEPPHFKGSAKRVPFSSVRRTAGK